MHEFLQCNSTKDSAAAPTTTLSTLLQKTAKNNSNLLLMDQLSLFDQRSKKTDSTVAGNSAALMSMAPKKPIDRRSASARYL